MLQVIVEATVATQADRWPPACARPVLLESTHLNRDLRLIAILLRLVGH